MSSDVNADPVCGDSFLAHNLRKFFTPDVTRRVLIPLVSQTSPVSLRTLDWLVVNYAKTYNIVCTAKDGSIFNIFNGYKVALSAYRRIRFDPFRRRDRHTFVIDGVEYETTLGQVNFVYWAEIHGVLDYAFANAKSIERHMNSFSASHKAKLRDLRKRGIPHKRKSLTQSSRDKCHVYHKPSVVVFDVV